MQATIHGVAKSQARLSDFTFTSVCLLRNLYAGLEARVRTEHGAMNWFQIEKGVHQACIQKTQTGALYQPRGVGWGERWE